jgi:hypothetical protein
MRCAVYVLCVRFSQLWARALVLGIEPADDNPFSPCILVTVLWCLHIRSLCRLSVARAVLVCVFRTRSSWLMGAPVRRPGGVNQHCPRPVLPFFPLRICSGHQSSPRAGYAHCDRHNRCLPWRSCTVSCARCSGSSCSGSRQWRRPSPRACGSGAVAFAVEGAISHVHSGDSPMGAMRASRSSASCAWPRSCSRMRAPWASSQQQPPSRPSTWRHRCDQRGIGDPRPLRQVAGSPT